MNQAVYNIVTGFNIEKQDTLVYDREDGFSWVRYASPINENFFSEWADFCPSAVAAEKAAREAGLDPQAIYYVH